MIAAPTYDTNDVVYLRESAAIGRIEAARISGVVRGKESWLYTITFGASSPTAPAIRGDRIGHVVPKTVFYSEDELISLCEALEIAEAQAQSALDLIQAQRASLCTETDVTAGTDITG